MKTSPLIIGHRGASAHAPENTLAAFQMAIDSGSDGIEFDVQLSKDGVPVVIHDTDLIRTGRTNKLVADLTSSELAAIDVGSWFNRKFPDRSSSAFEKERVPTLLSVLELMNGREGLIYIELKCNDSTYAGLARAVCEMIRTSPLLPQIIVKSFTLAAIPEVRKHLPTVQTAALFEPTIMDLFRPRKRIVEIAYEIGATQLSLHYSLVTKKLNSLAAEAGLPVTIWTADNPRWLERGRKQGIKAIITNDPAGMLSYRH